MKYLKVTKGDGVSRRARGPAGAAGRGGEGTRAADGAGDGKSAGSGGNAEGARAGGNAEGTGSRKSAGGSGAAGSGGNAEGAGNRKSAGDSGAAGSRKSAGGSGDAGAAGTERAPRDAPLNDYDILAPACPSRTVLRHVVDRWTPLVVAVLARGPHRFGELRAAVGGITPKVLTETLRSMERDGLVTRDQAPGVPPRVDYALTPLGTTLAEPMGALRAWAEGHAEEVLGNRARYDAVVHDGAR